MKKWCVIWVEYIHTSTQFVNCFHCSKHNKKGELGYMRLEVGKNLLGIEGEVAWATPGAFTVHNFPCHEDGKNCDFHKGPSVKTQYYVDPSRDQEVLEQHLKKVGAAKTAVNEEKRYIRVEAA